MTRAEFLRRLRCTPRRWSLDEFGCIRDSQGCCPIEAVFKTGPDTYVWKVAGEHNLRNIGVIVTAADNGSLGGGDVDPKVRKQLLAATVNRS
jgi:hypothetical protein